LIVLDLNMPGVDGFAVARHLRGSSARCALLALSARDDGQTRQRAQVAGFDLQLVKPVDCDAFMALVGELLPA
jgi:DNA-binding response OmpR family regulator